MSRVDLGRHARAGALAVAALALASVSAGVASVSAGVASVSAGVASAAGGAAAPTATTPAQTVTATLIGHTRGTLAPGTKVRSSALGKRVFATAKVGFALASVGQAQYPAYTPNGGGSWVIDGPALHVNAAQAPLVVTDVNVAGPKTFFAFGGGQVIDVTSDQGKHWYRAIFDGLPMAVVRNASGRLVAFVDGTPSGSTKPATWQYASRNGGRSWHLTSAIGG